MKKLLLLLCLSLLIGPSISATAQELRNGDFAKFEKKLPVFWSEMDDRTGVEKTENGIRLTVKKEGTFHCSFGQTIKLTGAQKSFLLTGTVDSETPQLAYLQVKLYSKKKEIRRISSSVNTFGQSELRLAFQTESADSMQILCRLNCEGRTGKSAVFSNLKLKELPPGNPAAWTRFQGHAQMELRENSVYVVLGDAVNGKRIFRQILPINDIPPEKSTGSKQKRKKEFAVRVQTDYIDFISPAVVLYKNGKELKTINGKRNKFNDELLRLTFEPEDADSIAILIQLDGDEIYCGEKIAFSEFYFGSVRSDLNVRLEKPILEVKPGYNVCSIYLRHFNMNKNDAFQPKLQYRPENSSKWLDALDPVYIPAEHCLRGSILNLKEDSLYQFRLTVQQNIQKKTIQYQSPLERSETNPPIRPAYEGNRETGPNYSTIDIKKSFRTLSVNVPIARTIELTNENFRQFRQIVQSGTKDGYIRYTAKPGTILDAGNEFTAAILIEEVSCIILDGLTIRGGQIHGVQVRNAENIQIINCDIAGFGTVGTQRVDLDGKFYDKNGRAINNHSGVSIRGCRSVLVERCFIHDPRNTSNSWFYSHPAGPNAIVVGDTIGAAIRYNDFIGSDRKRWNDTIECAGNGSNCGGAYQDAEICGNYLAFGDDDGMELDGGQINCRFFFNRTEGHLCGVSTAPCRKGPSYVFQNVFCNPGDEFDLVGVGVKNNYGNLGLGQIFFFNNTTIDYTTAFSGPGGTPEEYAQPRVKDLLKAVGRNNLSVTRSLISSSLYTVLRSDFDYDLFYNDSVEKQLKELQKIGLEQNGIGKKPIFLNEKGGRFELAQNSPGNSDGTSIPNIAPEAQPNRGAFLTTGPKAIPERPVPFLTDVNTVSLNDRNGQPESAEVVISTDKNAPCAEFIVRQPDGADFFTVSPQKGSLRPGQSIKLTVTSNPDKIRQARRNTSAFTIRLANGLSRPVSVTVDSRENQSLLTQMRAGAIYGTIHPTESGAVDVTFDIPKKGEYWLFIKSDSNRGNWRTVTIDDGQPLARKTLSSQGAKNPWLNVAPNVFSGDPNRPFLLDAGKHRIRFTGKSGDRVRITKAVLDENADAFRLAP